MAYYFKMEILSGYSSIEKQMREIEFYENDTKIDISELSIVSSSTKMASVNWTPQALIDGVTTFSSVPYGVNFADPVPVYVIIKSNLPFNKVVVYNDAQGGYGIKELEIYTLVSDVDPLRNDAKWEKQIERLVSKGNQYPNWLTTQIEHMKFQKYLIKQNDNYYTIKQDYYQNGKFVPLALEDRLNPNKTDYESFGFNNINGLCTDVIIDGETFRPIDKLRQQLGDKIEILKCVPK